MKLSVLGALGLVVCSGTAHAAAFRNGSFEMGTDPGVFTTLRSGSSNITGWTVGGDSIDYIGSYWMPSNGSRSIDLSGNNAGSLSQTFDTTPGQAYLISFDLAGNPDQPSIKTEQVKVGVQTLTYTFNTSTTSKSNMGWSPFSFTYVANDTSTTLSFASLTNSAYGPALDNVAVSTVPIPASLPLFGGAILALAGLAAFNKRRGSLNTVAAPVAG